MSKEILSVGDSVVFITSDVDYFEKGDIAEIMEIRPRDPRMEEPLDHRIEVQVADPFTERFSVSSCEIMPEENILSGSFDD